MSFIKDVGKGAANIGKSTVNGALSAARGALVETGRAGLHATAPDDYEYYLCSFELFNSSLEKVGFISFVVMPNQIAENYTPIQTITKTHGGIVTVFNPSFNPFDISLSGTFGKKFRIVTDLKDPDPANKKKKTNMLLNLVMGNISNVTGGLMGAKSGYGLTKVLQHILQESNRLDENEKPYILVFNNYAFNTHYVVNVMNFSFQQSYDQNMIWNYSIQLKAVGLKPSAIDNGMAGFLKYVAKSAISNGINNLVNKMTSQVTSGISQGMSKAADKSGFGYLNTII